MTATISLDSNALGEELMIDFIQSEHGELQYGVMCRGTEFSFQVPKMLGNVQPLSLSTKTTMDPQQGDVQGVTESFMITDQPVTIPTVEWSTGPLSYYNFDSQENPQTPYKTVYPEISNDVLRHLVRMHLFFNEPTWGR